MVRNKVLWIIHGHMHVPKKLSRPYSKHTHHGKTECCYKDMNSEVKWNC